MCGYCFFVFLLFLKINSVSWMFTLHALLILSGVKHESFFVEKLGKKGHEC